MAPAVISHQTCPGDVVHPCYAAVHGGIYAHSNQPSYKEAGDTAVQADEPGLLCSLVSGFSDNVSLPG